MRNLTINITGLDLNDSDAAYRTVKRFIEELETDYRLRSYFEAHLIAVTGSDGLSFTHSIEDKTMTVTIND